MSLNIPVTEDSNVLTQNIDVSVPDDIVTQIHLCEQEVFRGWKDSKGLYNKAVLEVIDDLISITADLLKNADESLIVLSGCGTSGRLGCITVRSFNELLQSEDKSYPKVFDYLIAGGDLAFFTSQERAEDNPHIGVEDLKQVSAGKKRVLLIAITCGLSAPYVAGQIDYALDHTDVFIPVLLGFNPIELARKIQIEQWDKTFYQVAKRLEEAHKEKKGFVLNPIVGPEPITGSSRMKSGSATKILLDIIFMAAMSKVKGHILDVKNLFQAYELIQDKTYSYQSSIGDLIRTTGKCLNNKGHLYYISDVQLGIFGLLDASECPPTYGADFEDVRGFLYGGFSSLNNKDGDISDEVPISVEYFKEDRLPILTENDVVMFLCSDGQPNLPEELLSSKAQTCVLNITDKVQPNIDNQSKSKVVNIELPRSAIQDLLGYDITEGMWGHLVEISCKWLLNVLSTGAHVHKGKVYKNYMIDLKVSNIKLYHRAVMMIKKLTTISKYDSETVLLRSIYDSDKLSNDIRHAPIGDHIKVASTKHRVVPVAMILAVTDISVDAAHDLILQSAVVRIAISRCFHGNESFL